MLLGEVGKLREERRNIQLLVIAISYPVQLFTYAYEFLSEVGTLLNLRSKYDPGGMFDPDWWVYRFAT